MIILYGFFFAAIGYSFTEIIMGDLLLPYKQWLITTKYIPEWLKNPMGLCSVCFTGQISLWGMLPLVHWRYAEIIAYIGIISLNMVIVYLLKKTDKNGN